jgi:hypothetical protein
MEKRKKKKFWEELIAYFPWYDTGHIENDASNNSCVCICYRGNVPAESLHSNDKVIFTEPLPSNNKGIHGHTHAHIQQLSFFQNKESRLKSFYSYVRICRTSCLLVQDLRMRQPGTSDHTPAKVLSSRHQTLNMYNLYKLYADM